MTRPSVSVLMPVYNAEQYLAEAVESVLAQSYHEFEFIIIDDGSTDQSLRVLESYARHDSRVRLISRENRGLVSTLNEGLSLVRGDFVARMDADDLSHPFRLERQLEVMLADGRIVALGCGVTLMDPDGDPIVDWALHKTKHGEIVGSLLEGNSGAITHSSCMFRTNALKAIGGYREECRTAEDLDLFLRLSMVGELRNLSDLFYMYRQHANSVGHRFGEEQRNMILSITNAARRERGLPSLCGEVRAWGDSAPKTTPKVELIQKWAWWALGDGHVKTARKHAFRALRHRPFSLASWRVLACAIRGH